jgi:hypothetical protein
VGERARTDVIKERALDLEREKRLFPGDAIGAKICEMGVPTLQQETLMRNVTKFRTDREEKRNMNKVDCVYELPETIVRGDGKVIGQTERAVTF